MASYKNKISTRKMKTESGRIANAIETIKRNTTTVIPKEDEEIILFSNEEYIYLLERGECLWFIDRTNGVGDSWSKVIPNPKLVLWEYDDIVNVLDAQPWIYI